MVNISSAGAQRPQPGGGAFYSASKAALDFLTKCWATELAGAKIRVNAVAPGPTDTPILASLVPPNQLDGVKRLETDQLPLKRRGEPAEVALDLPAGPTGVELGDRPGHRSRRRHGCGMSRRSHRCGPITRWKPVRTSAT